MSTYRLRVDLTYNNTSAATNATTQINATLAANGRPETATRTGSSVAALILDLTEAQATSLLAALTPAWSTGTRTAGKVSTARADAA